VEVDLTGRSALVTGAGRGIGRATALALARCGARVVVTARSADQIESVAREIQSEGGSTLAVAADVARVDDVRSLFDRAGPVDILITSAGVIQPIAFTADVDVDSWLRNVAINLGGVFLTCRLSLPGMLKRGWGKIINVSSGGSKGLTEGWGAYAASKAGVEALTRTIAAETSGRGIRANAVQPGIVDTEMQVEIRRSTPEGFSRHNLERYRSYKERGMLRNPEDPARLILWLLSPEAEDVNGQVLRIDDPEVAAKIGVVPMGR
jgi:NAD(P)-dependent dehydrogenase (short-subunit alcohol dehydrogenase family)